MFSAEFFKSMLIPAMEADDVTEEAQRGVRTAMNNSTTTQDDDRPEEDLSKVDGIFDNGPSGNARDNPTTPGTTDNAEEVPANDQPQEDQNQDQPQEDAQPEDNQEEQTDENTDPNVDQNGEETEQEQEPENALLFAKKNHIRDNMIQLYNIVSGDIDILTKAMDFIDHQPTIVVISAIIIHLRDAKNYIFNTLTNEIKTLDYDELLQKYITLKRVYDVCIEMLNKHFESCGQYFKKKTGHKDGYTPAFIPRKGSAPSKTDGHEDDERKLTPGSLE